MTDSHRHCPHCGISMRPNVQACPACYLAEVERCLAEIRQSKATAP